MADKRWGGNGRVREVAAIEPDSRHLWLAGQVDEVEYRMVDDMSAIRDDVHAIRNGQSRIIWAMVGLLISITTLAITLLITGAVAG